MEDKYYIKISPENLSGDIYQVCYPSGVTYDSGCTGVYSALTEVLSGGTQGTSLLTGLTIPILFHESAVDIGYYSVFDGAILQMDVVKNFVFSATTGSPYTFYFYNTSEKDFKQFLLLSNYIVDWGDLTLPTVVTTTSPNYVSHTYLTAGNYTITLTQTTPWGVNTIKKDIVVPFVGSIITNPNGTAFFTPNIGSWSSTPISYDFIFSGDSENTISAQTSDNYISIPFQISGYTTSRIEELSHYGINKYPLYIPIVKNGVDFGVITTKTPSYTGYTIEGIDYFDFTDGTCVYLVNSSGLTSNWMVEEPMVKDEGLLNIISDPEVQSDIYVERGKNSALERVHRIGEVDNLGDLENYGYKFFNMNIQ